MRDAFSTLVPDFTFSRKERRDPLPRCYVICYRATFTVLLRECEAHVKHVAGQHETIERQFAKFADIFSDGKTVLRFTVW